MRRKTTTIDERGWSTSGLDSFRHLLLRLGTQPQQIHHPRRIPNVTALWKESLTVERARDLPKTQSMLSLIHISEPTRPY